MSRIEEIKGNSKSYLVFKLGNEHFAAHVAYVNQIIEMKAITSIPNTVDFVKGVINQTGKAIPVIDTRMKFGMSPIEVTPLTSILIMEVESKGVSTMIGALVDVVTEVAEISEDQVMPTPDINGTSEVRNYVDGIVNLQENFVMLLNIARFFGEEVQNNFAPYEQQINKAS